MTRPRTRHLSLLALSPSPLPRALIPPSPCTSPWRPQHRSLAPPPLTPLPPPPPYPTPPCPPSSLLFPPLPGDHRHTSWPPQQQGQDLKASGQSGDTRLGASTSAPTLGRGLQGRQENRPQGDTHSPSRSPSRSQTAQGGLGVAGEGSGTQAPPTPCRGPASPSRKQEVAQGLHHQPLPGPAWTPATAPFCASVSPSVKRATAPGLGEGDVN